MDDRQTVGVDTAVEGDIYMEVEGALASKENAEDWRRAIDKVVPAVVVLRITVPRAFDTRAPGSFHATGFVVDKRLGIILTNRHVVSPGPVVAEATFANHEEIPVHPIYRDPVHDFGFFRYDPDAIQFLTYDEIPLAPEAASVGLEIRVIGNDSKEKISILSGTLARLDRDAPHYTSHGYNDFNTFYIQAASGTKGGSSGSPVIDWKGRAVALNAGSKRTGASAFFLPLERVVRALKFLQKGKNSFQDESEAVSIPRGTLQVTFLHKGFNEIRRLGLQTDTEKMVREASPPEETGMLVVDSVVPGGPGHKHLEPGDVLICMNGEVITRFLKMEVLLDDLVDQKVELLIERGDRPINVNLMVQDLHSISPDHFLEVSGAIIHPLSYQQARNFQFQCGLVYVAEPGYMFYRAGVPRHAIIKKFAGVEIAVLEDLITTLSKLHRGACIPLEYVNYKNRHHRKSALVTIDHHEWYTAPQVYTRNDSDGLWTAKPAFEPLPLLLTCHVSKIQRVTGKQTLPCSGDPNSVEHIPQERIQELINGVKSIGICEGHSFDTHGQGELDTRKNRLSIKEDSSTDGALADYSLLDDIVVEIGDRRDVENVADMTDCHGKISHPANASYAEHVIEPTLVMVEVHIPPSIMVDGIHSRNISGTGVIVHHSQDMGLVAVDKNTVPVSMSDVILSFVAFPIEIHAEVVFLHPVHNYALVAYDPSALGPVGASVVRAAKLLPEPPLQRGDSVHLVGLSKSLRALSRKSIVTNSCAALNIGSTITPIYRAINSEVIVLDTDFGSDFSGVLTDERGQVQALWGRFNRQGRLNRQLAMGIPVYVISQVVEKIVPDEKGPTLLINGIKRAMPLVRILEVELLPRLLSKARNFGLSEEWVQVLVTKDPLRRQILRVKGCWAGSKAENILEHGDMILTINGEPVTCFQEVERACQALDNIENDNDGNLKMTIFRQGREIGVLVGTDVRDGSGTTRVVNWCGCIVQNPHPAVRALGFLPEEGHGVYVARCSPGSPVRRYGLSSLQWIVEVDGKPTPDLDAFVRMAEELEHGQFVRIRTVMLNGKPGVLTLKQDLHYWPTWELRFDPEAAIWRRKTIRGL